MDQNQLISRCQLGDLDSFEELYRLHKQKALGTAYLIAGNRSIAEDIVQEAFIICYQQIKRLKNPQVFHIWFYRILIRAGWRMAAKHKGHVSLENSGFDPENPGCIPFACGNQTETANDRLLIRDAVKRLDAPLKTVVILYYFNEMTVKEISKVLDCFQGTIKSRLYKARKILRKELQDSFKNGYAFKFKGEELKENG